MSRVLTIASREMGSMFRLPVGWIVIALYLLLSAAVFAYSTLVPGQPASLRAFFGLSAWLLLPVIPAVSMRLISEELRSGTIEPLLTSPVSDTAIVLGKFFGACGFLLAMLAPTAIFPIILFSAADPKPDIGPILAGYLSLVLQGVLYLSIGLLASSLTSNQTLAFLSTLFSILAFLMIPTLAAERVPPALLPAVSALSIKDRADDFARGVIDTSHIVFFLTASGWFTLLSVVAVQSRRWR